MSASLVEKRAALERVFEDYVLNFREGPGSDLYPVTSQSMTFYPGNAGKSGFGSNTGTTEIGFTFELGGVEYSRAVACTNGWLILIDEADVQANYAPRCVNTGNTAPPNTAAHQIRDVFLGNHLFLCPWWSDLKNTYRILSNSAVEGTGAVNDSYISAADATKITNGTLHNAGKIYPGYDPFRGGIKYYRGQSPKGRVFVVRWQSFLGNTNSSNIGNFDVVLYENGTIEYRYEKRSDFSSAGGTTPATIGIFSHGGTAGAARFRDFAPLLKQQSRPVYVNGGAIYDSTYTDGSPARSYCVSLNFNENWPGGDKFGATFTFSPPRRRRKQSKSITRLRDTTQVVRKETLFDDQITVNFTPQLVQYPSMLPVSLRTSSNARNPTGYTDLLQSGSIELFVTTSISHESALQDSIIETAAKLTPADAFSEHNLFEQNVAQDPYYSSASPDDIGHFPGTFDSRLSNKEVFRLSFPINKKTTMLANTSSLYYFNRESQQWNLPSSSIDDQKGLFSYISAQTNMPTSPVMPDYGIAETNGSLVIEDAKGFDAYGEPIATGNKNIFRTVSAPLQNQTFEEIREITSTRERYVDIECMAGDYPLSTQRSDLYYASPEETFTLPITEPFLIEKVVIEVPMMFGQSWFQDRTVTNHCIISGSKFRIKITPPGTTTYYDASNSYLLDSGGPGITVALFCQKKYGISNIRDLISYGTITHAADTGAYCKFEVKQTQSNLTFGPTSRGNPKMSVVGQVGLPDPVAVVSSSIATHTGSIVIKTTPLITNEVKQNKHLAIAVTGSAINPVSLVNYGTYLTDITGTIQLFNDLLKSSYWNDYGIKTANVGVNAFGRGMLGFQPSGASIFGGEYVTNVNTLTAPPEQTSNSFNVVKKAFNTIQGGEQIYMPIFSASLINGVKTAIDSGLNELGVTQPYENESDFFAMSFLAASRVREGEKKQSPYLVYPGDKLVLAAAKTRPSMLNASLFVDTHITDTIGESFTNLPTGLCTVFSGSNPHYKTFTDVTSHDVQFNTGSINISVYGTYVKRGMGQPA